MHSSRCIEPVAGLPTILLPDWGAQRVVEVAGVPTVLGFPIPRGQALWVQCLAQAGIVTLCEQADGAGQQLIGVVGLFMPQRFVLKHDAQSIILVGGDPQEPATFLLWLEDQRTMSPSSEGPNR